MGRPPSPPSSTPSIKSNVTDKPISSIVNTTESLPRNTTEKSGPGLTDSDLNNEDSTSTIVVVSILSSLLILAGVIFIFFRNRSNILRRHGATTANNDASNEVDFTAT